MLSFGGLHDLLSQNEIPYTLKKPAAAQELADMAKKRGGNDNISIVTIKIREK